METAGTAAGWVIFFHLPLISGSSISIGIGSNYSNLHELSTLPSDKELQCGPRLCLLHWLCCHCQGTVAETTRPSNCAQSFQHQSIHGTKNAARKEPSKFWSRVGSSRISQQQGNGPRVTLPPGSAPSNRSGPSGAFPGHAESGGDSSLLVSPLLVAGVVIGLVLFLSCATIVVGSLRKDGRLARPRPGAEPADAPDGFSHGGSSGELRSTCTEEFPPACDFGSYLDILSQVNIMYADPPPCYDECVGPGATQIYIPTDDPPPYSLTDPCQRNEISINIYISQEEEEASGTTGRAANYAVRLQELQQPISSISVISHSGGCPPVRDSGV